MFVYGRDLLRGWSRFMENIQFQLMVMERGTYPKACRFLRLSHHLHSPFEKSIIERTIQYIKDRTESFDDYFPCRIKNCKLEHIKKELAMAFYGLSLLLRPAVLALFI